MRQAVEIIGWLFLTYMIARVVVSAYFQARDKAQEAKEKRDESEKS